MVSSLNRRDFLGLVSAAAGLTTFHMNGFTSVQPNILWITCEDISPDLGCYGLTEISTPNIDRLASEGIRYTHAFGHAGVCAPVRAGIITAMYPSAIGANHMRTQKSPGPSKSYPAELPDSGYDVVPPPYVKCFTEYLRAAGYYCTNRSKTDYQFRPPITAWDRIIPFREGGADWRGRAPGQPFFCVINFTGTHESRIRMPAGKKSSRDLSTIPVAPYYPDTPVVRNDYACYYDNIETLDSDMQEILDMLEEDGLSDNTAVFFYGDHGRGLPRGKRWLYDSGIRFPLIIRWPGMIPPGQVSDELVGFIDLGPTALSIAGVTVPNYMHGRPFLGDRKAPPREYIFAARDRMDAAYDRIRAVRDKRYKLIRNYMPDKPYAQPIAYRDLMPTMQEMRRLDAEGRLTGPQALFMRKTKPPLEFYDTLKDPYEIDNRAGDPAYASIIERLESALDNWLNEVGDMGAIPETELVERFMPGGVQRITETPLIIKDKLKGMDFWTVTLSCGTEGASIAYTTETGEKAHWKLYTGPVRIDKPCTVRTRAIRIGYRESDEATTRLEY